MSRALQNHSGTAKSNCKISVRRGGITHICFVDLDTCTDLFALCDEKRILASIGKDKRPFFFCFLSSQLAEHLLQRDSFYTLFTNHRLELRLHSEKLECKVYAAQEDLIKEVINQHSQLDSRIKFTILGGNHCKEFDTSFTFLSSKQRDFVCIDPGHIWTGIWIDTFKRRISDNSPGELRSTVLWQKATTVDSVAHSSNRQSDDKEELKARGKRPYHMINE
ncbi:hypothetical protein XU18_2938 [Perkinsela sp. CCAP 1560/4]|nr:hypothetical protein XU18_2938 [Perkinsela sp. CCAP 1560/4]|eukprot:KNH06182.1 hypothetical protein XU18_2938 [Perkinsela sp. CCAP 1560/4]